MLDGDELTSAEAAELLGVNPSTLTRRAQFGQVPARRFGKSWVFRRGDLELIRSQLRQSPRRAATG